MCIIHTDNVQYWRDKDIHFPSSTTVPSCVTALQMDNKHTTGSLLVSWQAGWGVFDGYSLQLLDERGSLVTNSSEGADATQHRFGRLTPGKKYRVLVQTLSGGIPSKGVSAEGRTRTCLHAKYLSTISAAENN